LFEKVSQINDISSVDELLDRVEELDFNLYQGIIAQHKTNFKQIKIVNKEYEKYYQLRGNNPNVRFRYLELRNYPDKLNDFYYLYPKSATVFDQYEETLHKISRMIYHFYVNRYIKNQFVTLPKEEFLVMKKCHEWYCQDKKMNRVFSKKVMEILNNEPSLHLYKMIRRYNFNQNLALHHQYNMAHNIPGASVV
jgi:hypothetical protein